MANPPLRFVLVLFSGCLSAHMLACGSSGDEPEVVAGDSGHTLVRVAASESALPLLNLLARDAMELDPRQKITFLPPAHSKGAVAATHEGEAEIGVVTRALSPEEEVLGLQYLHMARDGLVFVTHEDVNVQDLTSEQVRGIYAGEITNWKALGGNDAEIVVLDRPEHSSPKLLLRELVFGDDLAIADGAIVLERPSQMVLSLSELENSIGYASLPEILSANLSGTVISLDGVAPTPQNIEDNLYTLTRHIGLVIDPAPSRGVMNFVNFAYQDRAQQLMRSHGYSPVLMTLVIATIPERTPIRQEERYRPLVDYLSRKMGDRTTVSLKHLPSYEVLVDEFRQGGANSAFFGSFTYALAQSRIGVEPVARPETGGNSWYRGLIFVRKDSGIDDWEGLRGKRFSMIKDTTAGDIFPRVYLKRNGVGKLEEFFGSVVHAGSHDTSVRKVLSGEVEAGAAKDLVYGRLAEEDPRIHEELKILAQSPPVPDNALVIRSDVHIACLSCHQKTRDPVSLANGSDLGDLALDARLRDALLEMDQSADGRRVLELFGADRFVATTDADYENLYEMIEELGLDLSRR